MFIELDVRPVHQCPWCKCMKPGDPTGSWGQERLLSGMSFKPADGKGWAAAGRPAGAWCEQDSLRGVQMASGAVSAQGTEGS